MASRTTPVVCTLSSSDAGRRVSEWSDLRRLATSTERLVDGVRFRLAAGLADDAADLAAREAQCCTFLDIRFRSTGDDVEMTITSPNPDGVPVVHLMAGLSGQ